MKNIVVVSGTNACGKSSISKVILRLEKEQGGSIDSIELPRVDGSRSGYTKLNKTNLVFPGFYFWKGREINCGGCDTISKKTAFRPVLQHLKDVDQTTSIDTLWLDMYMFVIQYWLDCKTLWPEANLVLVNFDLSPEQCLERVQKRSGKSYLTLSNRGRNVMAKWIAFGNLPGRLFRESPPSNYVVIRYEWSPEYSYQRIRSVLV